MRREGWEGGTKCGKLQRMRCNIAAGRGKKSVKNRAVKSGFGELRDKRLEFRGEHQDALGLQGAADSREGLGEMMLQEGVSFAGVGARFDGAFEERGEDEATLLKVGEDFFRGLPCRVDAESRENHAGRARERGIGRIEKV